LFNAKYSGEIGFNAPSKNNNRLAQQSLSIRGLPHSFRSLTWSLYSLWLTEKVIVVKQRQSDLFKIYMKCLRKNTK